MYSMYLNVSQCISMYLNVSQCTSMYSCFSKHSIRMQTDTRLRMLAPSCITVELQLGAASVLPQRDTWDTSAKVIFWSVIGDVRIVRSKVSQNMAEFTCPMARPFKVEQVLGCQFSLLSSSQFCTTLLLTAVRATNLKKWIFSWNIWKPLWSMP